MQYLGGMGIPESRYDAYVYFKKAAEKGHLKGKVYLADIFEQGHPYGWKKSSEEVMGLYREAAEGGEVLGYFKMGMAYFNGRIVEKSDVDALIYFLKGAELGHAESQGMAGTLYALGQGHPVNMEKAEYWLRKSADQGFIGAIDLLAELGL